jgi:hypothetical protein
MPPQQTLYLHLGLPKTATTYVQTQLWRDRQSLRRQGLLYPGTSPDDHFLAAVELSGQRFAGHPVSQSVGAFDALLAEIEDWGGSAIISHELLCGLRTVGVGRLLDRIGDRRVVPLITVRDLSAVIPATFQERARNQAVESWADFLDEVRQVPGGRREFWRFQNLPAILATWQKFLPGDQIRVITVSRRTAGRDVVLERFGYALGVEITSHPDPGAAVSNESLGATQLRILQEVNRLTKDQLSWADYNRLVKFRLVPQIMAQSSGQTRMAMAERDRPWVEAKTERMIKAIGSTGCHVIGDLDELKPTRFDDHPTDPDVVSTDEVARAAAEHIVRLALSADYHRSPSEVARQQVAMISRRARGIRSIYRRHANRPLLERWRCTVADVRKRNPRRRRRH